MRRRHSQLDTLALPDGCEQLASGLLVADAGGQALTRGGPVQWSADFTALSAGAAASLPGGLTLTRASAATVQTGDATVVTAGIGVDVARVGRRVTSDVLALVLEEQRTNSLLRSRELTNAAWVQGGTNTADYAAGPDASVSADRLTTASATAGTRQSVTVTSGVAYTGSTFVRAVAGTPQAQVVVGQSSTAARVVTLSPTAFQRVAVTHTEALTTKGLFLADGRAGLGGFAVAQACDEVHDLAQLEQGSFATEPIVTTTAAATRAGERLALASGASLVNTAGQIRLELKCVPKGARSGYAADIYLWSYDVSNYAKITPATGVLTVAIGGVTNTTSAITWAANDALELWVVAGGGVATLVEYRVNGGAKTVPTITGAALGALSMPGACDVLCNATANQFTAWVQYLRAYRALQSPAWA